MKNRSNFLFVLVALLASMSPGMAQIHVESGDDVSLTRHGYLRLGAANDENIAFDVNEIQARDNGLAGPLFINLEGGIVQFGRDATSGRIKFMRYSGSGSHNLWIDNDGFLTIAKLEKTMFLSHYNFHSIDTEKDFEYQWGWGVWAKNNRNNTTAVAPINLPVGSEIKGLSVYVRDPEPTDQFVITLYRNEIEYDANGPQDQNEVIASSQTYPQSPNPCGGISGGTDDCFAKVVLPLPGNIVIDGNNNYLIAVTATGEWKQTLVLRGASIIYLEP